MSPGSRHERQAQTRSRCSFQVLTQCRWIRLSSSCRSRHLLTACLPSPCERHSPCGRSARQSAPRRQDPARVARVPQSGLEMLGITPQEYEAYVKEEAAEFCKVFFFFPPRSGLHASVVGPSSPVDKFWLKMQSCYNILGVAQTRVLRDAVSNDATEEFRHAACLQAFTRVTTP